MRAIRWRLALVLLAVLLPACSSTGRAVDAPRPLARSSSGSIDPKLALHVPTRTTAAGADVPVRASVATACGSGTVVFSVAGLVAARLPVGPESGHAAETTLQWLTSGNREVTAAYSGDTACAPGRAVQRVKITTATTAPKVSEAQRAIRNGAGKPAVCNVDPPDGAANITAAITGCANGSIVRFPPGKVYRHEKRIEVVDRVDLTIDGNGSRFISSHPNVEAIQPNFFVLDGRNVYLKNVIIEGNFKEPAPRSPARVAAIAPNQFNSGVIFYGGDGVGISDATIVDVFGDGVTTASSGIIRGTGPADPVHPKNVVVRNVTIQRTARQGIAVTSGSQVRIEGNRIRDAWYWGVDVENDVTNVPLVDVRVNGNTFDGSFFGAIVIPALAEDARDIEVRGNEMLAPGDNAAFQCSPAVLLGYWPQNPVKLNYRNVTVADNRLKSWAEGVAARFVVGGSITGNVVEKFPACGSTEAVAVAQSQNVAVADNRRVPS